MNSPLTLDAQIESLDLDGFTQLVREFDALFEEWEDDDVMDAT